MLGILLALHLGAAQATMLPAPPSAHTMTTAAPLANAAEALPCHHAADAQAGTPATPADHGCCDAGQCHCPIFVTVGMRLDTRVFRPANHLMRPLDLTAARSLRPAPDLRPPIAA